MHRQSLTLILSIMPLMLNAGNTGSIPLQEEAEPTPVQPIELQAAPVQPIEAQLIQLSAKIATIHNASKFKWNMYFGGQTFEILPETSRDVDAGISVPTRFTAPGEAWEQIRLMIPSGAGIEPRGLEGEVSCTQQLTDNEQFISVYADLRAKSPCMAECATVLKKPYEYAEQVPATALSACVRLVINICYGNHDEDIEGTNIQGEIMFRHRHRSHSTGEKRKSHSTGARQRSRSMGANDELEQPRAQIQVTPEQSPQLASHRRRSQSERADGKPRSEEDDGEGPRTLRHSTGTLVSPRTTITSQDKTTSARLLRRPTPYKMRRPSTSAASEVRPADTAVPDSIRPDVAACARRARPRSMT